MRRSRLPIVLLGIASALPLAATAQVFNPDNDSAMYFAANRPQQGALVVRGTLASGDPSPDGLYVWKNAEQGWTPADHRYVVAEGRVMHASNCLAYNAPAPERGVISDIGKGA